MKNSLLLLAFALFPFVSMAQDAPNSDNGVPSAAETSGTATFLDLKWGSGEGDVKALMAKRKDVTPLRQSADQLVYVGGKFAGVPVETWHLRFADGKFYEAEVSFAYPLEHTDVEFAAQILFEQLGKVLTDKSGETATALKTGEHNSRRWYFSKSDPPTKDTTVIWLYYGWNANTVTMTYTNRYYQKDGADADEL
jgi:hypothetical protein